ncbi:rhodanese-like domain-containing protein [Actinopolymorpha rutila]|uniref:Rhodanese-related sulfurtransferase n=1 Tax=Actinopolymorpha rutila TaxID=446787 RepID=A0A852ZKA5_9ACTN|nr:rhodanese-like domain-containing protein [Actinopolymorpha rutila]NYH89959.1 rhodanese-related sulfurtransferase [Actinopolymorpha rutila]
MSNPPITAGGTRSSAVAGTPAAPPATALAHFAARLSVETDVSDVHADLEAGAAGLVVVDVRSNEAWEQGHLPGAIHLPTNRISTDGPRIVPADALVVTYCWGPGCNGATRAALEFARLNRRVKEMLGGFEYWVREGLAVETAQGRTVRPVDPLTAPQASPTCDC